MPIQTFVVRPTFTVPKLTEPGDALNLLAGARPRPPRLTVALVPVLVLTVNEEEDEIARVGLKTTSTGTAWPGWMTSLARGGRGPRTAERGREPSSPFLAMFHR